MEGRWDQQFELYATKGQQVQSGLLSARKKKLRINIKFFSKHTNKAKFLVKNKGILTATILHGRKGEVAPATTPAP